MKSPIKIIFLLLLFTLGFQSLTAQNLSPKEKQWNSLFANGKIDKIYQDLANELNSPTGAKEVYNYIYLWRDGGVLKEDLLLNKLNDLGKQKYLKAIQLTDFYLNGLYYEIERTITFKEVLEMGDLLTNRYLRALRYTNLDQLCELYPRALAHFPDNYAILNVGAINIHVFRFWDLIKNLSSQNKLSPIEQDFFQPLLIYRDSNRLDDIVSVENYLKYFPNNSYAQYILAYNYYEFENYEKSAQHSNKILKENPLFFFNNEFYLKLAARQNKTEAEILENALSYIKTFGSDLPLEYWLALGYFEEDHYGQCRKFLEKIPQKQYNTKIYQLFGKLEASEKNFSKALINYNKAFELSPKNNDVALNYFKMLQKEQPAIAVQFLNANLLNRKVNRNIAVEINRYYKENNENNLALNATANGLEYFPTDSWLLNEHAENLEHLSKFSIAQETILKSWEVYKPYSWSVNKYVELFKKLNTDLTNKKLKIELDKWLKIYPDNDDFWTAKSELISNREAKINLWKEAQSINPDRLFPSVQIRQLQTDAKDWENALQEMERDTTMFAASEKDTYWFNKAITLVLKSRNESLKKEEQNNYFDFMERYLNAGGYIGAYHQYNAEIYEGTGNKDKAIYHHLEHIKARPNVSSPRWSLATKYRSSEPLAINYYKELCNRNPNDKDYLESLINLEVQWSGSPINGYFYAQDYKNRFPNNKKNVLFFESKALSQLGDNVKLYVNSYLNSSTISKSKRYVNWLNSARRQAMEGTATVDLNRDENSATILLPDGTMAKRYDDPHISKIKKLEIGQSFAEASYNAHGNLTSLNVSNGQFIRLDYNESHRIISLETNNDKLYFEYNENNKPIVIKLINVGTLNVTYDDKGEILKVESDDGSQTALKITTAFQQLLALTKIFEKASVLSNAQLPDLGFEDDTYNSLKEAYDNAYSAFEAGAKTKQNYIKAGYDLALYLYNNIQSNPDYSSLGLNTLVEIITQLSNEVGNKTFHTHKINTVSLFYEYLIKVRRYGVALDFWDDWVKTQEWLNKEIKHSNNKRSRLKELVALQQRFTENPVKLLATEAWLPKSILQNRSYWKSFSMSELSALTPISNNDFRKIVFDKYGHVVLVAKQGLFVRKSGYWSFLTFNMFNSKFEEAKPDKAQNFEINDACVLNDKIILATSSGLITLKNHNLKKPAEKINTFNGLPIDNVKQVASTSKEVFIYGDGKVWIQRQNTWLPIDFNNEVVQAIQTFDNGSCWVRTQNSVFKLKDGTAHKILNQSRDELAYVNNTYFTRKGTDVFKLQKLEENDNFIEFKILSNVVTTSNDVVYGMKAVRIPGSGERLAVLTDLGLSFLSNDVFEHFYVDLSGKPAVLNLTSNNNQIFMQTSNGFYQFKVDKALTVSGKTENILYNFHNDKTYRLTGGSVFLIDKNQNYQQRPLEIGGYYEQIKAMCLDQQGNLVVASNSTVYRVKFDAHGEVENAEELFFAEQTKVENLEFYPDEINDIMVDQSGAIWLVKDVAVFRYQENAYNEALVEEFNFFVDAKRFPSFSHYLTKIYQDLKGEIFVVASDEGHLYHKNIRLDGGLLKYKPNDIHINEQRNTKVKGLFEKVDTENLKASWFVNSYTPLNKTTAIIGTNRGFAKERFGVATSLTNLNDPSYKVLKDDKKALFLGTKGTKVGEMWLFGCEAGVVGYYDGVWFFPEALNALLPEDLELGKYGARAITSIASDKDGVVYIGTHRGMTIYEAGENGVGLLMENKMQKQAIEAANTAIMQSESTILLKDLDQNSNAGKRIKEVNTVKQKIVDLEYKLNENTVSEKFVSKDSIRHTIQSLQKRQAEILLNLEQAEPAVFQALTLPPLDLQSSRSKLNPDEAVIQFIPMSKRLFINFVSKDKTLIKEVPVSSDSLNTLVKSVIPYLYDSTQKRGSKPISTTESITNNNKLQYSYLSKLYDLLLKPIKSEIKEFNKVMVVSGKFLHYLPIGALCYDSDKGRRFAIQDHNIGYLSSMYLFQLVYNYKKNNNGKNLIIADPDGTLPGALAEGESISKLDANAVIFKRNRASFKNFDKSTSTANSIHLATHGYLEEKSIKNSWLQFSDRKLPMSEIYTLDLDKINFVVLSACETALGTNGLEYAHLGRAFANAGVPSVVATLWAVNDDASKMLMIAFYNNLQKGQNKYEALANAQRSLIKQSDNTTMQLPAMWAPYIVIGKP